MIVLGMDPSVNQTSYALVDSHEGLIDAGILCNPYRPVGKIDHLVKATSMCALLAQVLPLLKGADIAIMEASCGHCVNIGDFARMALVSGAGLGACYADRLVFVAPPTWKIVKDKDKNHVLYFEQTSLEDLEKLAVFAEEYPQKIRHNLYDAFCIAAYGLNTYDN